MPQRGQNDKKSEKARADYPSISCIDLFCGVGGLTSGLESAGIDVTLGIDIDPACAFPYEANNDAKFLLKSVADLSAAEVKRAFKKGTIKLLAGCAPCQPFSTYMQGNHGPSDDRWHLLKHFSRLVLKTRPDIVTMENVPRLATQRVFSRFVKALQEGGYYVSYRVVNCLDYGVAQHRNRLVLLASRLGPIEMIAPTAANAKALTVRRAIGKLPALSAGEVLESDRLHQAAELSPLNLRRIRASKPGGTWRDWSGGLVAKCHRKKSGKTYPSVYGRMSWDEPAPTMTTQYYGFGNGRFGHPEQDRAISLREGAILQSFPRKYKFVAPRAPVHSKIIGRLIGNAVPVNLGKAIGRSIVYHVAEHAQSRKKAA
jgi:DNA (cytosine-5)-methyltransferase 1